MYTKGTLTLARLGREAPIAAASPNGPALRNPAYGSLAARGLYPEIRQTRPSSMPRSPVIGTDSPVQYEPSESPGVRKRMPVAVGARPALALARANRPSQARARAAWEVGTGVPAPTEERRPIGEPVQTPAPFEYERATSVEGAIATLQRIGPEARLIAGGHSLLPMMKLRLANPEYLIDINDLEELAYIDERITEIRIGALTRHAELLESELLARRLPVFRDAEEVIADPVVRNRGTIGGSLCQADAAEDLSAVCAALKAKVVLRGPDGERVIGMDGFYLGPFTTAVGAEEMLTEVRIPLRGGAGSAHEKVERRAGDFAIAAVSAAVWIEGGVIADAGLALGALGPTTIIATRAEEAAEGQAAVGGAVLAGGRDRQGGLLAGARRPRTGRLQAPPRERPHRPRASARDQPAPCNRRPH